jgi:hypothetical protein
VIVGWDNDIYTYITYAYVKNITHYKNDITIINNDDFGDDDDDDVD